MRVSRPISVSLPDYGVLFAESIHATNFRMPERIDPFGKLVYVLHGRVDYLEKGRRHSVAAPAGTILIVPRGIAHRLADHEPSTLLLLCLDEVFLESESDLGALWSLLTRLPARRLSLSRPDRRTLEGHWQRAMLESARTGLGHPSTVRALAAQTLVLLARLPSESDGIAAGERVAAVIREIEETFYEPWSVDRAAARAGLSRRRFTDLFLHATGLTFWDFLNRQRLTHAARLLRQRRHSITGVMFACGFNDVSHFYRLFSRHHGHPPGKWLAIPASDLPFSGGL